MFLKKKLIAELEEARFNAIMYREMYEDKVKVIKSLRKHLRETQEDNMLLLSRIRVLDLSTPNVDNSSLTNDQH